MGGVLCFYVLVVYVSFNCWEDCILHDLSLTKIPLINVIECEENLFSFHCCSLLYASIDEAYLKIFHPEHG